MLVLDGVSKSFGRHRIFDNVSLGIAAGAVVGVVDYEGQAILELVNMLSGQHAPDSGQIYMDDQRLTWEFRPQQHHIGCMVEKPCLTPTLPQIEGKIVLCLSPVIRYPRRGSLTDGLSLPTVPHHAHLRRVCVHPSCTGRKRPADCASPAATPRAGAQNQAETASLTP